MTALSQKAAQLCEDAADVVLVRGHRKYLLGEDKGGPVCANGALNVAATGHHLYPWSFTSAHVEALAALCAEIKALGHWEFPVPDSNWRDPMVRATYVARWNNHPGRTEDEVREVLMRTAKHLRED